MEAINKSPHQFLDAFSKEDKDLFFGRETEVNQIYDLTFDTKLIVFFGGSGTGKTSIAKLIGSHSHRRLDLLSAVHCGVKDIRKCIDSSLEAKNLGGKSSVLFLDVDFVLPRCGRIGNNSDGLGGRHARRRRR